MEEQQEGGVGENNELHTNTAAYRRSTHGPELDEVLQHRGCNEQAVEQGVRQEQDEELVVGEPHTVVDPATNQEALGEKHCLLSVTSLKSPMMHCKLCGK